MRELLSLAGAIGLFVKVPGASVIADEIGKQINADDDEYGRK